MRNYAKAIVAIAIAAISALVTALGTGATDFGDIDAKSWLIAAIAVMGSGGMVWLTDNGPAAPAIKAIMAFLTAGFGSAVIALDDDLFTRAEQLTALAAAAIAAGAVFQVTNKPDSPTA